MKPYPSDPFLSSFLLCLFWQDDPVQISGDYMATGRPEYMITRTPAKEVEKARAFCERFRALPTVAEDLGRYGLGDGQAGHDLALSCNGNGSGFFDRVEDRCPDYERLQAEAVESRDFSARDNLVNTCNCPWHAAQRLQRAAQAMGNFQLSRYKGRNYFYP